MQGEYKPTVVVVDDEESVADAYMAMLQAEYDVRVAYGGEEALEIVDDDVEIVLLDRRMPDLSGDEVLAELADRGVDVRVVMTTAVEPTTDILEMPFDDYLCKPVDMETLRDAVAQQVTVREFDDTFDEFLEITAKIGVLERKKPPTQLASDDQYQEFLARHEELEEELAELRTDFETVTTEFKQIDRA